MEPQSPFFAWNWVFSKFITLALHWHYPVISFWSYNLGDPKETPTKPYKEPKTVQYYTIIGTCIEFLVD